MSAQRRAGALKRSSGPPPIAGIAASTSRRWRFRPYRAFAAACLLLFVLLMVAMGDRPYHLGPLYYGEAGALQRYEPACALPAVYSGQNSFFLWGTPPEDATTVIAVGMGEDPRWLDGYFEDVRRAARIGNAAGGDNEEQGQSIWVCRGPKQPWAELWPEFQHYD